MGTGSNLAATGMVLFTFFLYFGPFKGACTVIKSITVKHDINQERIRYVQRDETERKTASHGSHP
jgi:hypothetical protein